MPISVIILTRNNEGTIKQCIESVQTNSPQEILVIDGHSSDKTVEIARRYTSKIYFDGGKGISYARQLGAESATEEYITYVDSDVILLPNTLEVMLGELKMKGYGAINTLALNEDGSVWGSPGEKKATIPMFCTLFPRELVLKYKFDSSLPNCDDFEISYKLLKHGHKIAVSSAEAYHYHPPRSFSQNTAYRRGTALAEFLLKYKGSPSAVIKYVIIRGLGAPAFGILKCLHKGHLRIIPGMMFYGTIEVSGFIMKLSGTMLTALKSVFKWR